jgi:two-component system phosphate regulon response regulator OmpR
MPDARPSRIIVVDDDPKLRDLLRRHLSENGLEVLVAADAPSFNRLLLRERVDLIVLDLMLPGEDGLSILRRLRGAGDRTPVIMLTARSEEIDRIIGLELGADDYLGKPFNPRELLARIGAVLRRQQAQATPGAPEAGYIRFGAFTLDLAARSLRCENNEVTLTTGEYALLKALARHPQQPLSRERLMVLSRGRDYEAFDRSLDVQVSRLRRLIETDPAKPRYIQTVWGIGYVFVPDPTG